VSLLQAIVNHFVCWVQTGVTNVINAIIAALAVLVGTVAALLPNLPSLPSLPTYMVTAEGWVAWVFPVHQAVLVLAFILTAWLVWQVVALAMRWAKFL
jgi:hypothetical protein